MKMSQILATISGLINTSRKWYWTPEASTIYKHR